MALPVSSRACQIDACCERVPATLARQGVCLSHYIDEAFTRTTATLQLCQHGHAVDPRTLDWLLSQGELTVQLLSKESQHHSMEQRSQLLELLLCLTNIQEYLRHHAVSAVLK